MRNEAIPITPSIVTWARKRAGFSLEDAQLEFKKIAEWEGDDEVYPTYPQLEKLADKFKVPIAVFFFPDPKQTSDLRPLWTVRLGAPTNGVLAFIH